MNYKSAHLIYIFLFSMIYFCFFSINIILGDSASFIAYKFEEDKSYASSTLIEKGRPKSYYSSENIFDNDENTAWCEGARGVGINEYIEIDFKENIYSEALIILNGYGKNKNLYYANNRVKDYILTITTNKGKKIIRKGKLKDHGCGFSGERDLEIYCDIDENKEMIQKCKEYKKKKASSHKCSIEPYATNEKGGAVINYSEPMCLKKLRLQVKSVYKGKKYNDTCIAELRNVIGAEGTPEFTNKKYDRENHWKKRDILKEACEGEQ